jgi:hypothetical protein
MLAENVSVMVCAGQPREESEMLAAAELVLQQQRLAESTTNGGSEVGGPVLPVVVAAVGRFLLPLVLLSSFGCWVFFLFLIPLDATSDDGC